MINYTNRLYRAINKATWAHRNQKRKGSDLPFIVHPYSVMSIASYVTDNEDILIACLLHDVIEDVPEEYSKAQIVEDFGQKVLDLVLDVTKDEQAGDWREKCDKYLYHIEFMASDDAVIVSCADKIHNLISILDDYKIHKDELWKRFNSGKEDQYWWYESNLGVIRKRLPNLSLVSTLDTLVKDFKNIL